MIGKMFLSLMILLNVTAATMLVQRVMAPFWQETILAGALSAAATPEAGATPPASLVLLQYRVDRLESLMGEFRTEHAWISRLLIGNLVAVIVALATYLLAHKRR